MPRGANTQIRDFSYPATTYTNAVLPALWLASTTNPENGTVNFTYNNDGTLASKQYGSSGNKETYNYDTNQRLQYIHRYPNGGSEDTNQLQTFGYDANGYNGMLTSAIFATNVGANQLQMTNNYAYTLAGNVSIKTLSLLSANHNNSTGSVTVNYTYDNQGVLNTIAPTGPPRSPTRSTPWSARAASPTATTRLGPAAPPTIPPTRSLVECSTASLGLGTTTPSCN